LRHVDYGVIEAHNQDTTFRKEDTTMERVRHTLSLADREKASGELQALVFHLIALRLITKQAHWAVVSRGFKSLHEFLDELAAYYGEVVDELAERMLALGIMPEGQAKAVADQGVLEALPCDFIDNTTLVTLMADRLALVAGRARQAIGVLGEVDPPSQDMVIALTQTLEKQLWMLQAMES